MQMRFEFAAFPISQLTQSLLFGADSAAVKEGRIASSQALSGTGALRVAADFIKHFVPDCRVSMEKI